MLHSPAVPVLLIIFNRPEKVRLLMEALEAVRPTRLFIAADGPRPNVPTDAARCAAARRAASAVSWPCEVHTNFSDTNRGVDPAVERGIDWFFAQVERGIIFEDDCIPHPDFFSFAEELLARYENDERVMMVSGSNFQDGRRHGGGSYYFSRYPSAWGWATWRRAWRRYDTTLSAWPSFIASRKMDGILPERSERRHWRRYFESLRSGRRSAWDAKWLFAIWNQNGLTITPNVNLVRNVGFGSDSTHTFAADSFLSVEAIGIEWPLVHPPDMAVAEAADRHSFEKLHRVTIAKRLRRLFTFPPLSLLARLPLPEALSRRIRLWS
jgi:hypothetical protein